MPNRDLNALSKACASKARAFFAACETAGLAVQVTCTRRTYGEQVILWAMGRTAPGPVVTYAKPGTSKHETGDAFDVVLLTNGRADWDTKGESGKRWQQLGAIGEGVGLTWGGRFRHPDYPHFQI
jgi:peptidoglycan LD-endopeptidase CwlK